MSPHCATPPYIRVALIKKPHLDNRMKHIVKHAALVPIFGSSIRHMLKHCYSDATMHRLSDHFMESKFEKGIETAIKNLLLPGIKGLGDFNVGDFVNILAGTTN